MEKYRTFIPRLTAALLDAIILLPLVIIADQIASTESFSESGKIALHGAVNVVNILYFVVLHAVFGQTAGKYLTKVRVVSHPSEERIGFGRALLRDLPRFILVIISFVPGMSIDINGTEGSTLSPLMLLATIWSVADIGVFLSNEKRRALHDLIGGTVVVRVDAEASGG